MCHISLCYNYSKQIFPLGVHLLHCVCPNKRPIVYFKLRIFSFSISTNWLEFSTCDVMGTEQMFGKFEILFSRSLFRTSLDWSKFGGCFSFQGSKKRSIEWLRVLRLIREGIQQTRTKTPSRIYTPIAICRSLLIVLW